MLFKQQRVETISNGLSGKRQDAKQAPRKAMGVDLPRCHVFRSEREDHLRLSPTSRSRHGNSVTGGDLPTGNSE